MAVKDKVVETKDAVIEKAAHAKDSAAELVQYGKDVSTSSLFLFSPSLTPFLASGATHSFYLLPSSFSVSLLVLLSNATF